MEFLVRFEIKVPPELDGEKYEELMAEEKRRGDLLWSSGRLLRIWRVPGRRASIGLYDFPDATELHAEISTLAPVPVHDRLVGGGAGRASGRHQEPVEQRRLQGALVTRCHCDEPRCRRGACEAMKAAFYYGPGDVRLEQAPEPSPGPGEVQVKVLANGLCGTDLHQYFNGPMSDAPLAHHCRPRVRRRGVRGRHRRQS